MNKEVYVILGYDDRDYLMYIEVATTEEIAKSVAKKMESYKRIPAFYTTIQAVDLNE